MPTPRNDTPDDASDPEEHIQRLVKEFEERLRQQIPACPEALPQTLEQIEQAADRLGQGIKHKVQKGLLGMAGSGYVGESAFCPCREVARYVAAYKRQVVTRCAVATLWRAYYYCGACKKGLCPLDGRLGIGRGQCSAGVRALLSRFARYLPYRKAATEMGMICGVRLCASTVRRQAQAVGRALEQDRQGKERQVRPNKAKAPPHRPSSLRLPMDGVLIDVGGEWRELKCAVAYETGKDERGHAPGVERARYYATLAPWARLGGRVRALAFLAGAGRCSRIGVVADGSEWIWQEAGKHLAHGTQILDIYHACEHLWPVAPARFGQGSQGAGAGMQQQKGRLLWDQVQQVIGAAQDRRPLTREDRELRRRAVNYLGRHAHRMLYGRFRDSGWHIGSGVMGAACKSVVQSRVRGVGMRWSEQGAEAVLHLRSAWCNTEHRDFAEVAQRSIRLS